MKCNMIAAATGLLFVGAGVATASVTDITEGEVDVGVNYADGAWDLHIHDEENEIEYEPGEAQFVGRFPSAGPFIFPAVENPALPFTGIGAEELAPGTFVGDTYTLNLVGLSGPGSFQLTRPDPLGVTVIWDSLDGLTPADSYGGIAGGHEHLNWVFSAPGEYLLTVQAQATLPGGVVTTSDPTVYTFQVLVPEPATLGAAAMVAGLVLRRRR
jgi:surface-anchored protein